MNSIASTALSPLIRSAHATANLINRAARNLEQYRFLQLDFRLHPDDIVIASYPRSGTTWLQMLLHQLCTDGEMTFGHISQRQPWLERQRGSHPLVQQRPAGRRIFKTHLEQRQMAKGPAKHIYVYRDGRDVAVSYFHFYRTQLGFPGSFDDFFVKFMAGDVQYGTWFRHVHEWLTRSDPNATLFIRYEDMKADLDHTTRSIAKFCGIELTDEIAARVRERCDIRFMKQHQKQFNHWSEVLWENKIQPDAFIGAGKVGDGQQVLKKEHLDQFNAALGRWPLPSVLRPTEVSVVAGRVATP
jgi:hypothetical protein